MMIATDPIHGSIFLVVVRRKGSKDDEVIQIFQNFFDRLGFVKAELICDQEPSTLAVANTLGRRCQSTNLVLTVTPRGSIRTKDELASGRRANRLYIRQSILDKYGRTTGCPGCVGFVLHTEDCRARIEQEMFAEGDALKFETRQEQEGDPRQSEASPKRRKTGESDANPGAESSPTADTPKRRESEQALNVESSTFLTGCIAAVNENFV